MLASTTDVTNAFIIVSEQNPNDIKVVQLDRSQNYKVYLIIDGKPTLLGDLNQTLSNALMKKAVDSQADATKLARQIAAQRMIQKRRAKLQHKLATIGEFEANIPPELKQQFDTIMVAIGATNPTYKTHIYNKINETVGSLDKQAWAPIFDWFNKNVLLNTQLTIHDLRASFITTVCKMSKNYKQYASMLSHVVKPHDDDFWANYQPV